MGACYCMGGEGRGGRGFGSGLERGKEGRQGGREGDRWEAEEGGLGREKELQIVREVGRWQIGVQGGWKGGRWVEGSGDRVEGKQRGRE